MNIDHTHRHQVLRAVNIQKRFSIGNTVIPVLSGVDIELMAGEIISIQGESGSGKTTLLHILSCLETMDSGELYWNQQPVHTLAPSQVHKHRSRLLGMVFQQPHLVPELNTTENVLLAAKIAGNRCGSITRAKDLLARLGLEHRLNHPVQKLSGGEKQRVVIARALINRPPVLLADEPTGNLDEKTSIEVFSLFLNVIKEEHTGVLLVTHSPALAERAHHMKRLHLGKLENIHV
jgi:ABC-type lipoprotein export system ATPase subunit